MGSPSFDQRPRKVHLRPWRSFDPTVKTAGIVSGVMARFHRYEAKQILTGFYYPGERLVCPHFGQQAYPITFRALTTCEIQIQLDDVLPSNDDFIKSHEMLLESLMKKSVLTSDEKMMYFLSRIMGSCPGREFRVELGNKAIAACTMLSVRQVTRVLNTFLDKGYIQQYSGEIVVNRKIVEMFELDLVNVT